MTFQEGRRCNGCGYDVTYMVISDAHDPNTVEQFVSVMLEGELKGMPATTDFCPQCGKELSLESTSKK